MRHTVRQLDERGAFTLIELIAVMVVVAILAAVVTPSFTSASEAKRGVGARLLAVDLNYARQRALASGVTAWVTIDLGNDQWTLLEDDPATPGLTDALTLEKVTGVGPWIVDLDAMGLDGVDLTAANFDGGVSVGFDWLGKPRTTAGGALAADGVVTFAGGHTVVVRADGGVVETP
ncbi:MAG: GspH/FimT family protein [Planctomycetota bacterium]